MKSESHAWWDRRAPWSNWRSLTASSLRSTPGPEQSMRARCQRSWRNAAWTCGFSTRTESAASATKAVVTRTTGHGGTARKSDRSIFMEDFEGHFRRRSNRYCYFQLDYFYKAWDYVNDFLTHAFGARTQQVLKPQGRQIKALDCRHQLVHEVADDDPGSIYYYLRSVHDFGIADLHWLFENRLERFRRFGAFVHGLKHIDESNAEAVVDN